MQRLTLSSAFIVPVFLLSACGQEASSDAPATEVAEPVVSAGGAPAVQQAGATASLWNAGGQQDLDLQFAHPNGVVLQLTSLQSRPTETAIGISVINGRDREIQLNRFNNRDGFIVLDNGERLYLSPPAHNSRMSVPGGQTLEGELVFLGRLPPVQSAVLILNENASTDNRHTNSPGFRIELPLAGSGI